MNSNTDQKHNPTPNITHTTHTDKHFWSIDCNDNTFQCTDKILDTLLQHKSITQHPLVSHFLVQCLVHAELL